MSTKAEAILGEIQSLPAAELRALRRLTNRLVARLGKAGKLTRGKRALAALLRGCKVKGDTESWLCLTRRTA